MGAAYFPPSDSQGGWRVPRGAEDALRVAGIDVSRLDEAFDYVKGYTGNGGLLVVRDGWLVYERYVGRGHREATPNLASCGKSFTSIAIGILLHERPDLFPEGLDQKIYTPEYLPEEAFPLTDPAKADIKLGHLLAMTSGLRGMSPGRAGGQSRRFSPEGPDGWAAMVDAIAFGKQDDPSGASARTLWCKPGEGASYATAGVHLASVILRHVTGMEMQGYITPRLAEPLGWSRWGYGYKHTAARAHTPGGGGIALRATDMLRFGYLLLNEGRWGDRQLVPADYVRHATNRSPYNPHSAYSLQFEVRPDVFSKGGSGGHHLYVVPSQRLVVFRLGGRDEQYDESDTGLPRPPGTEMAEQERADWVQSNNGSKTLEMVRSAVVHP